MDKISKMKELNAEYGELLSLKKRLYAEYRQAGKEIKDYQTEKYDIDRILNLNTEEQQKRIKRSGRESAEVWGICHFGRCPSFSIFGKVPQDSVSFLGTQPICLSEYSKGVGHSSTGKRCMGRTHALLANL